VAFSGIVAKDDSDSRSSWVFTIRALCRVDDDVERKEGVKHFTLASIHESIPGCGYMKIDQARSTDSATAVAIENIPNTWSISREINGTVTPRYVSVGEFVATEVGCTFLLGQST
jgi:pyruvate-formate lyase